MNDWLRQQDPDRVQTAIDNLRTHGLYDHYVTQRANGDEHFGLWLRLVDKRVRRMTAGAISTDDLADWPSHDTYTAGLSPADAIQVLAEWDDLFEAYLTEQGAF